MKGYPALELSATSSTGCLTVQIRTLMSAIGWSQLTRSTAAMLRQRQDGNAINLVLVKH